MTTLDAWPTSFDPGRAPVFTHNEITSTRSPTALWPALVRAAEWPSWYAHATDVRGIGPRQQLGLGTTFTWKTLGVRVTTTVTEFVPYRSLAWSGTARGSRGYHRWQLTPTDDGGCTIVTEEVQTGLAPLLLSARLRKNLFSFHQDWLEGLVAQP